MFKYLFIITIIPLILASFWFRQGNILGIAEGALPFYNLQRYVEQTQAAWMEHPGLGNITLLITATKPTFVFLNFLQNLGIPGFILQAGVFYFLLTGSGIAIFLLTKEFFPKLDNKYALLSVFFYWFSPLALTEVWNRFLLNYIFFFGGLPVFLLILIKGLKTKKYYFAPLLALMIGIYSYTLSALVFVLLLWFLFILFAFFLFITDKDKSSKWFYLKFLGLLALLFIFTNSWWIVQLYSLKFQMSFSQSISNFSTSDNLQSLNIVSNRLGDLTNIFRFINNSSSEIIGMNWINFFNNSLAVFFEFLVIAVILFTIVKNRTERSILILGTLFFIIIFLMKGTNGPLGEIYGWIFQIFTPFQVFRNPFEKFSFVLNLIAALLIGYSISTVSTYLATKTKNQFFLLTIYLFFFSTFLIMSYPFFSSLVFTTHEPPTNDPKIGYQVKVPNYYKDTSDLMESKGTNFRFIGFPLGEEGITYKWDKGYTGVELPSTLFSTPGILFNTAVPYYNDIVPQLENLLKNNDDFLSVTNSLNVRFFYLRTDVDWQERNMENPEVILARMEELEKRGLIKKVGQFGLLTLWENLTWKDYTFYGANKLITSTPQTVNLYNIIPKVASGEATISEPSSQVRDANLSAKIVVNSVQSPNPRNLDYETYTAEIDQEGNYQIQLKDLTNFKPGDFLEKKLISIDGITLTTLNPIHFSQGKHQIVVNNLESGNMIEPLKASDSTVNGTYSKNFQINNLQPGSMYYIYLGKLPTFGQDVNLFIYQDNDKIRNGQNYTDLKQPFPFSTVDKNALDTIPLIKRFFVIRASSSKAWISLQSAQPLDTSYIKDIVVTQVIKPKPFFTADNNNLTQSSLPKISYKKISTTKYQVHIEGSSSPFVLVFSELFNIKWEAFYDGNAVITPHFRTNTYANGWLINRQGNFDITIEFTPERLFEAGETIATISHLLNISLFVFLLLRSKRQPD